MLGSGFVPLFGVLGFELAIVGALFGSVAGLDLGAAFARELMWSDAPAIERARYPGRALARGAVHSGSARRRCRADSGDRCRGSRVCGSRPATGAFGIKAYLTMPLVSAALAGGLGHALGVAGRIKTRAQA